MKKRKAHLRIRRTWNSRGSHWKQGQKAGLRFPWSTRRRWMQKEPFCGNCFLFCLQIQILGTCSTVRRPVKRVGYERGYRAKRQRRKIENARGQNLWRCSSRRTRKPSRENRFIDNPRTQWANFEILHAVPSLIQLWTWFLLLSSSFNWRDRIPNGLGPARISTNLGGFRGPSKHLNYLFERRSVSLNEGSRVWVVRFGSGDG